MFAFLTICIVIAAILLTIVVLLQSSKGEGLASNFVSANQAFGVRQTANILEKLTWGLVAFILLVSIVTSFTTGTNGTVIDVTSQIENAATDQAPAFPSPAPAASENPAE